MMKKAKGKTQRAKFGLLYIFSFFLFTLSFTACATKPSDMRTLVPAETLIYLETNDLAAALKPIVDAKPFKEVAKSQPDLSALKGVQLAVAVLGFEATEEKLTDDQSVGSVKPRFVAVADTHSWNSTAVAFAERKLGGFVAEIYGSEPKLEKSDKHGGKYFAWTAEDKRKAFALVIDGIVYFANDETAIDKCIAVRRGEADSILKTEKIKPPEPGTLARGYVSTDGIAQISGVIGMKLASEASDESEIQSAIAGILPKLIRGTITDINWTMSKGDQGIEDKYQIAMPADVANVFSETMAPGNRSMDELSGLIPAKATLVTKYNLEKPTVALQSIRTVLLKETSTLESKIITEILASFFDEYGINDPDAFLSSVEPQIFSIRVGTDEELRSVVATVKNRNGFNYSINTSFDPLRPVSAVGRSLTHSREKDMTLAEVGSNVVLNSPASVNLESSDLTRQPTIDSNSSAKAFLEKTDATVLTFGLDETTAKPIAELFAVENENSTKFPMAYFTSTRFTKSGMERRTVSDFGLIGQIIAQLADD